MAGGKAIVDKEPGSMESAGGWPRSSRQNSELQENSGGLKGMGIGLEPQVKRNGTLTGYMYIISILLGNS